MRYRLYRTASGTDVELATDHTEDRPIPGKINRRPMVRRDKAGIVYCYGSCRWSVEEMILLFLWTRDIDDTVTYHDIVSLNPRQLSSVDELRFYAELNEMGLSHLD